MSTTAGSGPPSYAIIRFGGTLFKKRFWRGVTRGIRTCCFRPTCIVCGSDGLALCIECAPAVSERDGADVDQVFHIATLGIYHDAFRQAILAFKDGRRDVGDSFVSLAAYRLGPLIPPEARSYVRAGRLALVGIPTTASRRRERGFDGGLFLADGLADAWGLRSLPILRQVVGDSQRGKDRLHRLQATQRFDVVNCQGLENLALILVDDVVTTGATLLDARNVLEQHGLHVCGALALARVPIGDQA